VSSTAELIDEENSRSPADDLTRTGAADVEPPLTVIEPRPGWQVVSVRELWRFRELMFVLAWRDVKVRYKQTVLGAAWAVLQPLATMAAFSMFFGRLAGAAPDGVPYPLYVFTGLLPWFFFANAVNSASNSVVGNQNLVTKIYFPRLLIPLAAIWPYLVDFAIGFALLLVMMLGYGQAPGWSLLLAPAVALGLAVAALGVGTLLAALTVAYRDFRLVVPFMLQLWMFLTPTVYMRAGDVVGPRGATWLPLNPAYGLIANFRAAVLGGDFDLYALAVSVAVAAAGLVTGCLYFRRVERQFADII
jgi:lipopolysaccharide transport system permease protein